MAAGSEGDTPRTHTASSGCALTEPDPARARAVRTITDDGLTALLRTPARRPRRLAHLCGARGLATQSGRDEHGAVLLDIEKLLRFWTEPLPDDDEGAADAFRQLYADPVTVNGTPLDAADMVARARVMQAALAEPEREVLAVVESSDAVAVAFRLAGRHVGPLDTPAGRLPASGSRIDLHVIDILSIAEGRISAIRMVGDWLGALAPAGMVHVQTPPVSEGPTGAT